MRTLRNVCFVVMMVAFAVAANARAHAASGECQGNEGFFCPVGCYYDGYCFSGHDHFSLDCQQVEECDDVYPGFCTDFFNYCYYDLCYGGGAGMVVTYGCGTVGGACNAECSCGGFFGCQFPSGH